MFVPRANKKIIKKCDAAQGEVADYREFVQQRIEEDTTTPELARRAFDYAEEYVMPLISAWMFDKHLPKGNEDSQSCGGRNKEEEVDKRIS
jgi:hypothetical protein